MGKILLWVGLIGVIVFVLIGFLSGATNGPDMKPILPLVYGTNQTIWLFLTIISIILFVIGLIMVIVKAIKNRQQQ